MKHISKKEWIEYLVGTCSVDRAAEIAEHAENCDTCSAHLEEIREIQNDLERWKVDTTGHEVSDKVLSAIRNDRTQNDNTSGKRFIIRRYWQPISQAAAIILIAVFLGFVAGRQSARIHIAQHEGKVIDKKPAYLAALDLQFASELTGSVIQEDETEMEVQE